MTIERLDQSTNELHEMVADLTHTIYRLGAILSVEMPEHFDNANNSVETTRHPSSFLDLQALAIDRQTRRLHSTNQAAVALLETLLHGAPEPTENHPGYSGTTMRSHLRDEDRAYLFGSVHGESGGDGSR